MGKQVTELDTLPSFMDTSLLPVHNGAGLKKGTLSQLANYLGTKFSNPNLLINPNFKINQRGQATYETSGASQIYSVDRWRLGKGKVTVNSDGTVTVTATGGTTNEEGYYQQPLENAISGDYTVSMEVVSISGAVRIAIDGAWQNIKSGLNVFHGITGTGAVGLQLANGASITLKWVKLEQGSIATPFVAPNYIEELMKCRYFYYQANVGAEIIGQIGQQVKFNIPYLRMRTNSTAKISTNGDANKLILSDSTNETVLSTNAYKDTGSTHIEITTDTNKTGVFSLSGIVEIELDSEIY